jgi:hypothetical protein
MFEENEVYFTIEDLKKIFNVVNIKYKGGLDVNEFK